MSILKKIISGGQTGADTGGLIAGKLLGLETGGTAPPEYMTEIGQRKDYLIFFGLKEGEADPRIYPKRTKLNIQDSDGTVIFGNINELGTRLTINLCNRLGKFALVNPTKHAELVYFLTINKIEILNVAGNTEKNSPGIQTKVADFLFEALF